MKYAARKPVAVISASTAVTDGLCPTLKMRTSPKHDNTPRQALSFRKAKGWLRTGTYISRVTVAISPRYSGKAAREAAVIAKPITPAASSPLDTRNDRLRVRDQ